MNKTISCLWHNRLEKSKESYNRILDALKPDWDIYIFWDVCKKDDSVYEYAVEECDEAEVVRLSDTNLGLKQASYTVFRKIFGDIGSDYNLHIEDDILVGPDSLDYADACYQYIKEGHVMSSALWSHPTRWSENSKNVHRVKKFSCWGWLSSKRFLEEVVEQADDQGREGWAINFHKHYMAENYYEFQPETRLVKNIGWGTGIHEADESHRLYPNDEYNWSGEGAPSYSDWNFCCIPDRCQDAINMDGVT